jgi:protein TonB
MSYLMNNEQKMNDIIFANRNKSYGAYQLRADYGNTLLKAIGLVILGFVSLFSTAYYFSNNGPDNQKSTPVYIRDTAYIVTIGTPPVLKINKTSPSESPSSSTEKNKSDENSTLIVDSISVAETNTTQSSSRTETSSLVVQGTGSAAGSGNGNITFKKDPDGSVLGSTVKNGFEVDREAEFEGGLKALRHFISSNVRYPRAALEEGVEGTIYLKFVVDEQGEVSNVSLYNKLGYGIDEEAVRVVSIIPKFKSPATVGGKAVKVYYQLPIKFNIR